MNLMKTNYCILLITLFSFSLGNAQSEATSIEIESNSIVSISKMNNDVVETFNTILNVVDKKEQTLIDASELKNTLSRTNSDIRTFLNRERKVDNIKMLFPKINKALKA